jgi:hypothetical protein
MKTTGPGEKRGGEGGGRRRTQDAHRPALLVACCSGSGPRNAVLPEVTPEILDRMNRIATYLLAASLFETPRFGGSHDRA